MCCPHGRYNLLMPTISLIRFSLQTKRLSRPCRELSHHGRSFIIDLISPELDRLEHEDYREILSQKVGRPMVPLSSTGSMADGNMANISSTMPINISHNPGTVENVYIGGGLFPR